MRIYQQKAYAVTLVNGAEIVLFGNSLPNACRKYHIHPTRIRSYLVFYPCRIPQ